MKPALSPPSRLCVLPLVLAFCAGTAGATSLGFGASYTGPGGALLRAGVQDYPLAAFSVGAGLSSRGLDAAASRAFVLTGLGALRARASAGLLYGGGLSGTLDLSGTLGPLALNVVGSAWNAAPDAFDPLERWAQTAPDLRAGGTSLNVAARYRLTRELLLNAGGTLGGQSSAYASAELRSGELSYRLGLRAGSGVLGASAGIGYSNPDSGLTATLDVLAGPDTLGLSGDLSLDGALGDGSSLLLYAAYEPWRSVSVPLRLGVQASVQAGPGTLNLDARGGWSAASGGGSGGGAGFGVRLGYTLPLDAAPDTP